MFQKLLVPLDGTPQAAVALPLAGALARATGAELLLVRVVPRGSHTDRETAGAVEYLDRVAAELRGDHLTVHVHATVAQDGVEASLVREVGVYGADAVVMATHGRAGVARAVLGSVAAHVLTHTAVPIVLLRPGKRRVTQLRKLLVPVDGTPGSAAALSTAWALASATRSRVVLVEVVTPVVPFLSSAELLPVWEEETQARATSYVLGLASALARAGVEAEGQTAIGLAGPTIVSTAERVDADLIVMSTRALTGAARALLGSTADEVVRTAALPVLLVHQAAPGAKEPPASQWAVQPPSITSAWPLT
jgi:nucleotide-binding universal stress UspA family protein